MKHRVDNSWEGRSFDEFEVIGMVIDQKSSYSLEMRNLPDDVANDITGIG